MTRPRPRPDAPAELSWPRLIFTAVVWLPVLWLLVCGVLAAGGK